MSRAQALAPLFREFSRFGRRRSKSSTYYYYYVWVWTTMCENDVFNFFFLPTNRLLDGEWHCGDEKLESLLYVHIVRFDNTRCAMR